MIEYPKIETLYDRDAKFKVDTTKIRLPEFSNVRRWHVTEKIDGTNIRIGMTESEVLIAGRTDNAQIPPKLLAYLRQIFTLDKLQACFDTTDVVLFGEGYGEKIQNGGNYRSGVGFRLFDVYIAGWWLEPDSVADVADKLSIPIAPVLETIYDLPATVADLCDVFNNAGHSIAAQEDGGNGLRAEGIVARTAPMLFTRKGDRLMWKLKFKDF